MKEKITGALTLNEAAGILGVCSATVNNWVKHEYISPVLIRGSRYFMLRDITSLKKKIDSGMIRRLASRANKKRAGRKFMPLEYLENRKEREAVKFVIGFFRELKIDTETALFLTALNILVNRDMADKSLMKNPLRFTGKKFKTGALLREMKEWHETLADTHSCKYFPEVLNFSLPRQQDLLGLIYQSLKPEGNKSSDGSYYTPREIVDGIVKDLGREGADILDPCCGTGQFLLSFAEKTGNPELLHGRDRDKTAVRIARLNLMEKFPGREFTPDIRYGDSLVPAGDARRYHMIATNPPWGMHFSPKERDKLADTYPEILSGESYSYFIRTGLERLYEGENSPISSPNRYSTSGPTGISGSIFSTMPGLRGSSPWGEFSGMSLPR